MKVVSIVTYNVKPECSEEFVNAFGAPGGVSTDLIYQKLVKVSDTHFICITEVDDVNKAVEKEDGGVNWLDEYEHLLVKYENGSRTDACSGLIVHEYEKNSKT